MTHMIRFLTLSIRTIRNLDLFFNRNFSTIKFSKFWISKKLLESFSEGTRHFGIWVAGRSSWDHFFRIPSCQVILKILDLFRHILMKIVEFKVINSSEKSFFYKCPKSTLNLFEDEKRCRLRVSTHFV